MRARLVRVFPTFHKPTPFGEVMVTTYEVQNVIGPSPTTARSRRKQLAIVAAQLCLSVAVLAGCSREANNPVSLERGAAQVDSTYTPPDGGPEKSTQFYAGNCTRWAAEQFDLTSPWPHCNWGGNANAWVPNASAAGWRVYGPISFANPTASLRSGSVVSWNGGSYGHVAYIEYVTSTGIGISEMNWVGFNVVNRRFLTWSQVANRGSYRLAGYILPIRK